MNAASRFTRGLTSGAGHSAASLGTGVVDATSPPPGGAHVHSPPAPAVGSVVDTSAAPSDVVSLDIRDFGARFGALQRQAKHRRRVTGGAARDGGGGYGRGGHQQQQQHGERPVSSSDPLKSALQGRLEEISVMVLHADGTNSYQNMTLRALYNYVMKAITNRPSGAADGDRTSATAAAEAGNGGAATTMTSSLSLMAGASRRQQQQQQQYHRSGSNNYDRASPKSPLRQFQPMTMPPLHASHYPRPHPSRSDDAGRSSNNNRQFSRLRSGSVASNDAPSPALPIPPTTAPLSVDHVPQPQPQPMHHPYPSHPPPYQPPNGSFHQPPPPLPLYHSDGAQTLLPSPLTPNLPLPPPPPPNGLIHLRESGQALSATTAAAGGGGGGGGGGGRQSSGLRVSFVPSGSEYVSLPPPYAPTNRRSATIGSIGSGSGGDGDGGVGGVGLGVGLGTSAAGVPPFAGHQQPHPASTFAAPSSSSPSHFPPSSPPQLQPQQPQQPLQHVTYRERLGGYLHPRDMRRLVTPFSSSNAPELMVRRHVMLLNFDPLRAVVLRDRLLVIVPPGADSILMNLEKRLRGGLDEVENEVFGDDRIELTGDAEEAIEEYDDIPLEAVVMDSPWDASSPAGLDVSASSGVSASARGEEGGGRGDKREGEEGRGGEGGGGYADVDGGKVNSAAEPLILSTAGAADDDDDDPAVDADTGDASSDRIVPNEDGGGDGSRGEANDSSGGADAENSKVDPAVSEVKDEAEGEGVKGGDGGDGDGDGDNDNGRLGGGGADAGSNNSTTTSESSSDYDIEVDEWEDIEGKNWIEMPFELQAVDAVLSSACHMLAHEACELEREVREAMAYLRGESRHAKPGEHAQERLRVQKDKVGEMESRVQGFVRAMNLVLDEDEDMALMNLSRLLTHPERFIQPVSQDILEEESDEPELILEGYLQQSLSTVNALQLLKGQITTTEELVTMMMDTVRNRLLYINTFVSLVTLCVSIGSFVGSIFGMNLYNGIEDDADAFQRVVISTCVGGLTLLILMSYIFNRAMSFGNIGRH